jgi:hypothetical protein
MTKEPRRARPVQAPDAPFRLTMRTDSPRRRTLCVILLGLSTAIALSGLWSDASSWALLIPAGLLAAPGVALLVGWIEPSVHELILDREALRWGKVGAAQEVVLRSDVASMYFGEDAGAAELRNGERRQLPMEIIAGSMKALAHATTRLWPSMEILTRFEDGSSVSRRDPPQSSEP